MTTTHTWIQLYGTASFIKCQLYNALINCLPTITVEKVPSEWALDHLFKHINDTCLCFIVPKFIYSPHLIKTDCATLRSPNEFLPSSVIEQLETHYNDSSSMPCNIRAVQNPFLINFFNNWNNTACRTVQSSVPQNQHNPISTVPWKEKSGIQCKDSVSNDFNNYSVEAVLIWNIPMCDIVNHSYTSDIALNEYWDSQLLNTAQCIQKAFPLPQYRIICLMGAGVKQCLQQYDRGRTLNSFIIHLLVHFSIEIFWSSQDDNDGVSWVVSMLSSIEKCRLRPPPSAFRAKTGHSSSVKSLTGLEKNWVNQLLEIPGVELETAKAIAKRFPAAYDLIAYLETNDPAVCQNELAEILVTRLTGTKKLNGALALRLRRLFGANAEASAWIVQT